MDFITKLPVSRGYDSILVIYMEAAHIARECDFRLRSIVCSKVDKEVRWDIGNKNEAINSFSSTNR